MAHVVLSRKARSDLQSIYDYIHDDLSDPDAARDTLRALRQAVISLEEMPERGIPLDTVLAVHTDFRFLLCLNYRIFYYYEGDAVEVVRILHTLQDYMRALFP